MADVDFDEFDDGYAPHDPAYEPAPAGGLGRLFHIAGALCSLALIIGLAIWGYKLAMRDVTGIPVVRALSGPLRIAPENPGGEIADNQGLSVNAVAAAGSAMPVPEKLVLAPKEAELTAEDQAAEVLNAAGAEGGTTVEPVDPAAGTGPDTGPDTGTSAEPPATDQQAVAMALADAVAQDAPPLTPLAPEADAEGLADATDPALAEPLASDEPVPADAVTVSVRPRLRPSAAPAAAATDLAAAAPTEAAAPLPEVDPATIPAGTRLVQLGAFDDEAGARREWGNLQARFAELIAGKAMVVQQAQSGGRTFYRLRAHGFADEDEARRFCAALLAENASCIPVAQR